MPLLHAASEFPPPIKITVNTSIFDDLKRSVSNIKTQVQQCWEYKTAKTGNSLKLYYRTNGPKKSILSHIKNVAISLTVCVCFFIFQL